MNGAAIKPDSTNSCSSSEWGSRPATQAERDAAIELVSPDEAARIASGSCDDHQLVQAFVRHRERLIAEQDCLRAEVLRWCDHVQRCEYLRSGTDPDASPHILADHARKLATALHTIAGQPQWQPVDTWEGQPTGPAASVLVCVSDGGVHDPIVGEAWYDPDAYSGTWWWTNLDKGNYHASPIVDMQHGNVTHWMPLPAAPVPARKDNRA